MKNIFWITILFFITSCGYTALYKDNKSHDIKITISSITGDQYVNNLINLELKNYLDSESNSEFLLDINTFYEKKVSTKDATGKPEEFQLSLITNLNINNNEKNFKSIFKESLKIKNSSDKFELNNYENSIKENFARSTKEKILLKLVSLQ